MSLPGDGHAIRVHGGHDVDVGVVQEPSDAGVDVVAVDKVRQEVKHQLFSNHL